MRCLDLQVGVRTWDKRGSESVLYTGTNRGKGCVERPVQHYGILGERGRATGIVITTAMVLARVHGM